MDEAFLRRALELAEIRQGFTAPNPSVGAVLVRQGKIIAEGSHFAAGHPHAEAEALKDLLGPLSDTTLYVSLEPCCHYGKTPPCTSLILEKKIGRVVYGFTDPNPLVAGKGEALLKEAGVHCGRLDLPEVGAFYESYAYWRQTGLPRVTAKLALSADGMVAYRDGKPAPLTGEACRVLTHLHRKYADALLSSYATLSADNPSLNVRLKESFEKKKVYILDRCLETPLDARLTQTAESLFFFHGPEAPEASREAWKARGAQLYKIEVNEKSELDWKAVLRKIGENGAHDLWVEAGPTLFQSILRAGCVSRAFLYYGAGSLGEMGMPAWAEAPRELFSAKKALWTEAGQDRVCELRF